jgi:TetR/AcrR family transcriptional regulator, copper-responsive repressor
MMRKIFLRYGTKMNEKPTRGRPRKYDPELALDAALGEFRRRGYTATSLDHLTEAPKMARPSLYAAFGNKFDIYRKAVRQYADRSVEKRHLALMEAPDLARGLETYFAVIIDSYAPPDGDPLGCAILSVISGEAAADPAIRAELADALTRTDDRFRQSLEKARAAGKISETADIEGMIALFAALQHSLALRARAGTGKQQLEAIARSSIALILSAAGIAPDKH